MNPHQSATASSMRESVEEILKMTRRNLVNVGLGLFPQNFTIAPSPLHFKLSETLVGSDKSTALAFPRGFGKSTYVWEIMTAWNIMHRKYRYIMFIGSSSTIAQDMFSNVKASIKAHPFLSNMIEIFRDTSDRFFYKIDGQSYFMACFGAGQQLRGKRFEAYRPDLVIMDDLEETEAVRSEDQRIKLKDWFFADVLPLDVGARFFFIGTYLHEDCLLANLIEEPPYEDRTKAKWDTFRFGVIDYDTGLPTWPEKYDEAWIQSTRKEYISKGQLYRFNTEYQNIAVDRKDRAFDPNRIRLYSDSQLKTIQEEGLEIIQVVDPGIKAEADHDPTVIMTTGMDRNGAIWILNVFRKRMVHHEILDAIVSEYRKWNPSRLLVESVQGQAYLLQDLEAGTWPGGTILPVEPIDGKQVRMGKLRIHGIEGLFEQRKLLVPVVADWWVDFCDELITFPRGKHDDILDCLAYSKLNHVQLGGYNLDVQAILNYKSPTVF